MKVTFLGAAGTVTGSKFLVETEQSRILVDCGLFQGLKPLRLRNWEPFPVAPDSLDAVILTHAHLDHSGYLPLLVREGFSGDILCTPPTAGLCEILLPDSGRIHEQDAAYANRKGFSKHRPAQPLYTEADALRVPVQFRTVEYDHGVSIGDVNVRFQEAGHILGAASVYISVGADVVLFSGDIGRYADPLMPEPRRPSGADWIIMESTYGDRRHAGVRVDESIAQVVRKTIEHQGVLLIPSFAVGRAQGLVYWLNQIFERGLAPRIPLFVDSPMATNVTSLYRQFARYHRLSNMEIEAVCQGAQFINSVDESKWLGTQPGPMIIVAASGMITGGRILHHLKKFAPRPETRILLSGFQAPGTRGAALLAGAEALKIHGKYVPIRASVEAMDALSAHADQKELLDWLGSAEPAPKRAFLVHGEPAAADALRVRIKDQLGVEAVVAEDAGSVTLAH